jgi:ABC-type transport system involved in multi-copper enzyme maturation permease subunit
MFVDGGSVEWGYYVGNTLIIVAVIMIAAYSISYFVINKGMQRDG